MALQQGNSSEFMGSVLRAINYILLDMLEAMARKAYEHRRNRQMQGISSAKALDKYKERGKDMEEWVIIVSRFKVRF